MGKPPILDDLTKQRIYAAVARGLPRNTAAKLAKISTSTLYKYLKLGREGDPAWTDFADRVREAEAKGEDEVVMLLREHARTSVPACIFLLERRNPEAWGKATEASEQAAKAAIVAVSPEEHVALIESVLAAARSAAG